MAAPLIQVTANMVTALSPNVGNYMNLFNGDTTAFWFAGWGNYPAQIVVDLQSVHLIDNLRVFDGTGSPMVKFEFADTPFSITNTISYSLAGYNSWATIPVGKPARYIYISLAAPGGDKPLAALEIYGISTGGSGTVTTPVTVYGDAGKALCTNSFHWVPIDVLSPFSMVREYNYWSWYESKQGTNAFQPSAETSAQLDTHFADLKANNIVPIFCLNQSPAWLNTYPDFDSEDRPANSINTKADDPFAYSFYARFMFQVAARYGRGMIPNNRLTVDSSNTPRSGLDLLNYISPWNEPDKWWKGPRGNIKANEYAALLSAVWDGHEGRISGDMGMKKADPTMQLVLGGLTDIRVDYINDMYTWFKANRTDKKFCADVIDVHHYSGNYGTELFSPTAKGISPEADNLKAKVQTFVNFVRSNLPNKEIWMSEFGYDTGTSSPQRATAYGSYSAQDVQAMWNIRSYLEILAGGMDKAFIFNIYDESNDQSGIFQTSGLLRSRADNLTKKVAWTKFAEIATKLKGLVFKGDQSTQANVRNYMFANADGSKICHFMWSPTENGTTINYTYNTKSYTVTEMPLLVDLSPTASKATPISTKKVLVVLDDTNKVGSKTTHELTLSTGDEIWVNGVQTTSDIQIVVKRAVNPIAAVAPIASGLNGTVSSNGANNSTPNGLPPTASPINGTVSSNGTSNSTPNGLPPTASPIPTGVPPIAPIQKVTTTVTKKMSLL